MTTNDLAKRHHGARPLQHLTDQELDAARTVFAGLIAGGLLRLGIHETLGDLLELINYEEAERGFCADMARLSDRRGPRP